MKKGGESLPITLFLRIEKQITPDPYRYGSGVVFYAAFSDVITALNVSFVVPELSTCTISNGYLSLSCKLSVL